MAVAISPAALLFPPVWHGVLRTFLRWQAARCGCVLTVKRITGNAFGTTEFTGVWLRHNGIDLDPSGGTDLTVEHVRCTLAWRLPWLRRSEFWVREMDLEGVRGRLDFTPGPGRFERRRNAAALAWLPANFVFQADDFGLRRGSYNLRASGLVVSGRPDAAGEMSAREVRAEAPGVTSVFADRHGRTFWKNGRLTVAGLVLGQGVSVVSASLDASGLDRRRLNWDCILNALGGEVRGQGTVDFNHERLALENARGSPRACPVTGTPRSRNVRGGGSSPFPSATTR